MELLVVSHGNEQEGAQGADHGAGVGSMNNGTLLMQGLIVAYVVIAVVSAWEGNWPRCTYWIGAAIITGSVLCMK